MKAEIKRMEKLNEVDLECYVPHYCDLDGRVVAVGKGGGRVMLSEIIFGDAVWENVVRTDLEAKWSDEGGYYATTTYGRQILLAGRSNDGRVQIVSCLIDPFAGSLGRIRKESVEVEWLDVRTKERFLIFGWGAQLISVGKRIIFYNYRGNPLYEFKMDRSGHGLAVEELGIKADYGDNARLQPISDHEVVVLRGGEDADEVSLVDLDSETVSQLPPLPYWEHAVSSILLLSRFVLVAGGGNFYGSILDMCVFDIQARKWSMIKRGVDWWGGKYYPLLSVSNGYVYIIGDDRTDCSHRISLDSLAYLIIDPGMRFDFMRSMGYSQQRVFAHQLSTVWCKRLAEIRDGSFVFPCPRRM